MPKEAGRAAPAVIFLNTGFEYHVGPHRHYVPLARELAAQGHVVLRYDLGGIGDSLAPPGAPDNVAYPAHALDDAREAIAFVRKHAPGRRLILAGLCSGGWHAFRTAREGLPVDAIVCINAPLYLRDGLWRMTRRSLEYREMLGYRRMLRDRDRWANALRGRSEYIYFADSRPPTWRGRCGTESPRSIEPRPTTRWAPTSSAARSSASITSGWPCGKT